MIALALILAIAAVICFGLGFAIKWLFIAAVICVVVAVVLAVTSRSRL